MKPYTPSLLPLSGLNHGLLLPLVGRANAELARYDGLLQSIPNAAVMLSPLTTREAVLSSRIEGTQASTDEVLEHEAGLYKEGEKGEDIKEILNYRQALHQGAQYLKGYPVRLAFIRELHRTLMSSVRGQDKTPGVFRKDQNWIGSAGTPIEQASFVPPDPLQLPQHLAAWERYLQSDDIDCLIQTAVVHAQFELLHPFKDGNGRIGRILIPLFLCHKRVLLQPAFYMSEYLEAHRSEYYLRLQNISAQNDWNGWIAFFLMAIAQQARQNSQRVREIQALYDTMKEAVQQATHSQYAMHVLDAIFKQPIFRAADLSHHLTQEYGIHPKTAPNLLKQLRKADILQVLIPGKGRKSAILCFSRLLGLVEAKQVW